MSYWNPWENLYFAALIGCADCFDDGLVVIDSLARAEQGDAWAIAARGWSILGRRASARGAWAKATAIGGPEVDALLPFMVPGGAALAAARARKIAVPGLCADAWCEVAALALEERDRAAVFSALQEALSACPDHAEARQWRRTVVRPLLGGAGVEGEPPPQATRAEDAALVRALGRVMPRAVNGWISPERFHRRAPLPHYGPVPVPGSALARLDDAGVHAFFIACDEQWAAAPADHPLVAVEFEVDQIVALVHGGLPAIDEATAIWRSALASGDREVCSHVARLVCELAIAERTLTPLAKEACDWLLERSSCDAVLLGFRAFFGALLGDPDAVERARAVLAMPLDREIPWRLAVGALSLGGEAAAAATELATARKSKIRREWARYLTGKRARLDDVRVPLTERLPAREGGGEAGGEVPL